MKALDFFDQKKLSNYYLQTRNWLLTIPRDTSYKGRIYLIQNQYRLIAHRRSFYPYTLLGSWLWWRSWYRTQTIPRWRRKDMKEMYSNYSTATKITRLLWYPILRKPLWVLTFENHCQLSTLKCRISMHFMQVLLVFKYYMKKCFKYLKIRTLYYFILFQYFPLN